MTNDLTTDYLDALNNRYTTTTYTPFSISNTITQHTNSLAKKIDNHASYVQYVQSQKILSYIIQQTIHISYRQFKLVVLFNDVVLIFIYGNF